MWVVGGLLLTVSLARAAEVVPPPSFAGDTDAQVLLDPWLESAFRSTESLGAWPSGPWQVHLHETDLSFETATGAPAGRFACWAGATLHLRPWLKLRRRDLGAVLRHELTHRRAAARGWRRWKEEALCLWAEGRRGLPDPWPTEPDEVLQARLDKALTEGSTASQRWAYDWLRAWLGGKTLPAPPKLRAPEETPWRAEAPPEPGEP